MIKPCIYYNPAFTRKDKLTKKAFIKINGIFTPILATFHTLIPAIVFIPGLSGIYKDINL